MNQFIMGGGTESWEFPLPHPLKNPWVQLRLGWVHRHETDFLQPKEIHFLLLISSRGNQLAAYPSLLPSLLNPSASWGDGGHGGGAFNPLFSPT